jgi:hypothetical protein
MDARREELSTADLADDRVKDRPRGGVDDEQREPADQLAVDRQDLDRDETPAAAAEAPGEPAAAEAPGEPAAAEAPGEPAAAEAPAREAPAAEGPSTQPLLAPADAQGFQARWTDVQHGFVDAPRRAVEQADTLVAELMQQVAKTFADERANLESQWDRGDDVSTDELRVAFQRYRVFFGRLLAT